jgi:hypothetical protein
MDIYRPRGAGGVGCWAAVATAATPQVSTYMAGVYKSIWPASQISMPERLGTLTSP